MNNTTQKNRYFKRSLLASSVLGAIIVASQPAQAFNFSAGEVDFEWNNHITYGAMYRVQSASKHSTNPVDTGSPIEYAPYDADSDGMPDMWVPAPGYDPNYSFVDAAQAGRIRNGNDGNLNLDGLVQNRISVLSELAVNYKNFGVFVRGRLWYDDVYKNGEPEKWDTNLGYNTPAPASNAKFHSAAADYLGSEAELLDAYVFTSFWIGDRAGSLKVGKQVINWGESMAFPNSVNSAINPADANAGTRAGVDLKETFMPTEAVNFQISLTDKIGLQAFYQWNHRGTVLLPSGSYFSESDMLGAGGKWMWAGVDLIPINDMRGKTENGGQYGIAFTYLADSGTEYGFYAVNSHDKTPSLQTNSANSAYDVWFAEDRKVFAVSFSSVVGDTNISGELSYRPNAPIMLSPGCVDLQSSFTGLEYLIGSLYPGDFNALPSCTTHAPAEIVDSSMTQAQVSFTSVYGGTALWDQVTLAGEIVGWYYDSIDKKGVEAKDKDLYATNTASGVGTLLRVGFDYINVFRGANLSIPMTWQYGWAGTNSRVNTREEASILSVGAALTFPNNLETSLVYTQYDGEDKDQLDKNYYNLHDRDNIAFSVKYSF